MRSETVRDANLKSKTSPEPEQNRGSQSLLAAKVPGFYLGGVKMFILCMLLVLYGILRLYIAVQ